MPGEKKVLKIALLGPPVVTFEDQIQTIKRKRTRSVLYFLACQKEPVSREFLISKFWPNLSEQESRKNLREILSNLRSHFSHAEVIDSRYDQLSLNPANTEVDVIRFQNIVDRIHFSIFALPSGKLPDSLYRDLREGVMLWRTPVFMDGFLQNLSEFETWIAETGNELQGWRRVLVDRLIDHNVSSGNLEEALYWLVDALNAEPLQTDLHYLVLTCLRDVGRTAEVFKYRATLERTYKTNHGMEVPQVLLDFIDRISDSQKQFVSQIGSSNQELQEHPTPFVGRKEILSQIRRWSLNGGVMELRGESGIGKTRTMQEFHDRIEFPFRSLFCIGRPLEQNLPLQPFIEGLRQAVKREEWLGLNSVDTEALLSIFPEMPLKNKEISSRFPGSFQDALPAIFEAILKLLNILSRQKRLVIFFDNAQWADDTSIQLLSFLTNRGVFHKKGFLILAHRIEERNPCLHEYITHVQAQPEFHSLQLDYLNDAEIRELAYSLLGKIPPAGSVEKVKQNVGGNPLFLIQTLKLMMDFSSNLDSLAGMENFPVARETAAAMKEKWDSLDQDTRVVLESAATIGPEFTPGLLEDVTQMKPGVLARILEDLVNLHVIRVDQGSKPGGSYIFSNGRMHQVLVAGLSPARSRMLNLQMVRALDHRFGKPLSLAARYAQHYEAAGETQEAYRFWLQAAIFAHERCNQKDAFTAYQRAMGLLELDEDQFNDNDAHDLIAPWAEYAFDQNDLETCERLFTRCLELGERRHSTYLRGTANSGFARLMGLRKQMVTAQRHMDLAFKDLANCEPSPELINAYINQGYLNHMSSDFAAARENYEKAAALKVMREDGLAAAARSAAQSALSMLYSEFGEPKKGDEIADLSIEGSSQVGCNSARIKGHISKSLAQFYMGNYRGVIEISEDVSRQLNAFKIANWATLFYSIVSSSYLCVGHLDRAWAYMQKAQTLVHEFTPIGMGALVHGLRGDIFRMLEFLDEAEKEYDSPKGHREDHFYVLENRTKLGYIKCLKGDLQTGIAMIEEAIQKGKKPGLGMITIPAETLLLMVKRSEMDNRQYRARLNALIKEASRRGIGTLTPGIQYAGLVEIPNHQDEDQREDRQEGKMSDTFSTPNLWSELSFHIQTLELPQIPDEIRQRSRSRITAILDTLTENAASDPVRDLVKDFVERVERKINS